MNSTTLRQQPLRQGGRLYNIFFCTWYLNGYSKRITKNWSTFAKVVKKTTVWVFF